MATEFFSRGVFAVPGQLDRVASEVLHQLPRSRAALGVRGHRSGCKERMSQEKFKRPYINSYFQLLEGFLRRAILWEK